MDSPPFAFSASFQLTSSRRGWPGRCMAISNVLLFQLTSSRRGWRFHPFLRIYRNFISTHILTKRMTAFIVFGIVSFTFQLTSSRRGWPVCLEDLTEEQIFQLTSSRRGWPDPRSLPVLTLSFQLTSSRRGWRPTICHQRWAINNFNSHPHEEDDLQSVIPFGNVEIFQLTSSRRGWLAAIQEFSAKEFISTHILTKRMTSFSYSLFRLSTISTHILTKRMTVSNGTQGEKRKYFNSHPHEEDDFV